MTQSNDIRLQRLMENQFVLRVACHDMANPLAIIMTALSICQSSDDIDEIHMFLEKIRRAANEQRSILRELRDAKGLLATDTDLRSDTVNAQDVIESALEFFSKDIKAKNLKINFDCDVKKAVVKAEAFMFDKLFIKPALANAIKFSEPSGKIDIFVSRKEKQLQITVRDEGIGIEEEWLPKIFSPDFKDMRLRTSEDGIGYALPLMKLFVERIGGTLTLTSQAKTSPDSASFTELKATIPIS